MPTGSTETTQAATAAVPTSGPATGQAIPATGEKAYTQSRTFKAAVLSLSKVLAQCSRILSAVILSCVLTVEGYATLRQTFLAYDAGEPLLQMGLPKALYYFLPGERKRVRGMLVENLLLLSLIGGAFGIFLALGGNRILAWRFNNPALEQSLLLLVPYALVTLPASALAACLLACGGLHHVVCDDANAPRARGARTQQRVPACSSGRSFQAPAARAAEAGNMTASMEPIFLRRGPEIATFADDLHE